MMPKFGGAVKATADKSAASKSTTKANAVKQPRSKTKADEAYNTRRRLRRAAERELKKANNSSSVTKSRHMILVKEYTEKALSTYTKNTNKISNPIQNIINNIGDIKPFNDLKGNYTKKLKEYSKSLLVKNLQDRNQIASNILSIGNISSRLYGGLIDVWQKKSPEKTINEKIMEHFNAKDMLEVLEKIEKKGIDLYSAPENDNKYTEIALKLQNYAAEKRR